MPEQTSKTPAAPATQVTIVCRLRPKELRRGPAPTAGEIELDNVSPSVIEIEYDRHPLQYLNLVVTDPTGAILSAWHYGNLFSPLGSSHTLRLSPGEKFTAPVGLLGNVPEERRTPGWYTVVAVYKYKTLQVISQPLQVQLPT
ncbi:MAG: hypothetical protein HYS12_04930 [Planctomycetes bacterium]|nr:hypothetical protein [Planctomycetota bacterium]